VKGPSGTTEVNRNPELVFNWDEQLLGNEQSINEVAWSCAGWPNTNAYIWNNKLNNWDDRWGYSMRVTYHNSEPGVPSSGEYYTGWWSPRAFGCGNGQYAYIVAHLDGSDAKEYFDPARREIKIQLRGSGWAWSKPEYVKYWYNHYPTLSVSMSESENTISCNAATNDQDNDIVTVYYEWLVNNTPASNNGPTLSSGYSSGDTVTCKATAYDGYNYTTADASLIATSQTLPPAASNSGQLVDPFNPFQSEKSSNDAPVAAGLLVALSAVGTGLAVSRLVNPSPGAGYKSILNDLKTYSSNLGKSIADNEKIFAARKAEAERLKELLAAYRERHNTIPARLRASSEEMIARTRALLDQAVESTSQAREHLNSLRHRKAQNDELTTQVKINREFLAADPSKLDLLRQNVAMNRFTVDFTGKGKAFEAAKAAQQARFEKMNQYTQSMKATTEESLEAIKAALAAVQSRIDSADAEAAKLKPFMEGYAKAAKTNPAVGAEAAKFTSQYWTWKNTANSERQRLAQLLAKQEQLAQKLKEANDKWRYSLSHDEEEILTDQANAENALDFASKALTEDTVAGALAAVRAREDSYSANQRAAMQRQYYQPSKDGYLKVGKVYNKAGLEKSMVAAAKPGESFNAWKQALLKSGMDTAEAERIAKWHASQGHVISEANRKAIDDVYQQREQERRQQKLAPLEKDQKAPDRREKWGDDLSELVISSIGKYVPGINFIINRSTKSERLARHYGIRKELAEDFEYATERFGVDGSYLKLYVPSIKETELTDPPGQIKYGEYQYWSLRNFVVIPFLGAVRIDTKDSEKNSRSTRHTVAHEVAHFSGVPYGTLRLDNHSAEEIRADQFAYRNMPGYEGFYVEPQNADAGAPSVPEYKRKRIKFINELDANIMDFEKGLADMFELILGLK
jgi:hypothetical protein